MVDGVRVRRFEQGDFFSILGSTLDKMGVEWSLAKGQSPGRWKYHLSGYRGIIGLTQCVKIANEWREKRKMEPLPIPRSDTLYAIGKRKRMP